ncbi:MAG: hypothetical protein LUD27_02365 [Clostridia bacterium]|nr:hypothetical protein [Clostridia bacterium]
MPIEIVLVLIFISLFVGLILGAIIGFIFCKRRIQSKNTVATLMVIESDEGQPYVYLSISSGFADIVLKKKVYVDVKHVSQK